MSSYTQSLQELMNQLSRLPGIGMRSAERIAFHLLAAEPADVRWLADVMVEVKAKARFCAVCGNVSEEEQCRICRDPRRDAAQICVVCP